MPFYLVCYKSESRRRYVHFSPSIVNSISFSVKFKGALGKAKIRQLLQPRSKTIVSLLNKFPLLMEQNVVFNREINEACAKTDILRTKNLRDSIRNGLEKIREEGWFSEKEYESFSQMLTWNICWKTFQLQIPNLPLPGLTCLRSSSTVFWNYPSIPDILKLNFWVLVLHFWVYLRYVAHSYFIFILSTSIGQPSDESNILS